MRLIEAINKFESWKAYDVKGPTVRGYVREIRNFCLFMRNARLEDITLRDVMTYLEGLRELGWSENGFIPKSMALRKFFEFCRLQGFSTIDENLIPIPRKVYKIPRVADEESYRKLVSVIPKNKDPRHIRNLAVINLLWDTGGRVGEILSLNIGDVNLAAMKGLVATEKSRGRRPFREIFWTHEAGENLSRWIAKREELKKKMAFLDPEALFLSISSSGPNETSGRRFARKGVLEMLRRYANKAGLEYMNPHSFRHHLGHEIINKGGSASDVMNILGHASLQSSSIYTMMVDRELEERYRKLAGGSGIARPDGVDRVEEVGS